MGRPDLTRPRRPSRRRVEKLGAAQSRGWQSRPPHQLGQQAGIGVFQQGEECGSKVGLAGIQALEEVYQSITPLALLVCPSKAPPLLAD